MDVSQLRMVRQDLRERSPPFSRRAGFSSDSSLLRPTASPWINTPVPRMNSKRWQRRSANTRSSRPSTRRSRSCSLFPSRPSPSCAIVRPSLGHGWAPKTSTVVGRFESYIIAVVLCERLISLLRTRLTVSRRRRLHHRRHVSKHRSALVFAL